MFWCIHHVFLDPSIDGPRDYYSGTASFPGLTLKTTLRPGNEATDNGQGQLNGRGRGRDTTIFRNRASCFHMIGPLLTSCIDLSASEIVSCMQTT